MSFRLHPGSPVACPADLDRLASAYCSAWNEPDPQRRLPRLRTIWGENATFDSAAAHVRGLRQMDAHIADFWAGRYAWRFVVLDVRAHGPHLHLSWKLVDPTGSERLAGHDVGTCGADRRLDRVVSFWRTDGADDWRGRGAVGAAGTWQSPRV